MDLNLANLKSSKAFSSKPVQVEIEWGEHKFVTYIRPLSYQTAMGDISAAHGYDVMACRIASSLCDAEGKQIMNVCDITGEVVRNEKGEVIAGDPERGALDPDLTKALLIAINKVQNSGKTAS